MSAAELRSASRQWRARVRAQRGRAHCLRRAGSVEQRDMSASRANAATSASFLSSGHGATDLKKESYMKKASYMQMLWLS